ncbi:hypothetical protein ACFSQT_17885 [Mesorhizobium calcicola]|uniref:Uncharacterized protein n=1 Tax=Mesorhizobium calcicola TaxID=1300310 RepID=A0ABW4WE48_9HYPH
MDLPLHVDPAPRVLADCELARPITEDDGAVEGLCLGQTAPQRAFTGDAERVQGAILGLQAMGEQMGVP